MIPTLRLREGRERSVERRHPWIFSGAVDTLTGDPVPGDTVLVATHDGRPLGWAAYSPVSQIRARMWTFDPDEAVDDAFVAGRIATSVARRRTTLDSGTDAARLVFSEADGVPGLIADRYGDTIVCQLTTVGADRWRNVIADALAALPGIGRVVERSDADVREREGLEPRVGPMRGEQPHEELVIHEDTNRFVVDAATGHKTGFYLDQRDARRRLVTLAGGRGVLNVFAYSGAFSIVSARAGAATITSIDSSGPALALARRNAEVNDLDIGELVEADAFSELRRLRDRARQYDLIVLDPPKLAANERQLPKASRAYKDLNLLALKLLAPGGILVTFSCSGAMSMDLFQKVVAGAALDARRDARIIGRLHQPADHPVLLSFPEAEYLKGLIVEV